MTRAPHTDRDEPFGALLGIAPGGTRVYSSNYDRLDEARYPDRSAFRSQVNGVYMGHKWQCVELARRWMYEAHGYVFADIAMAYDIFRLRRVTVQGTGEKLPLHAFRNGSIRAPEPGALVIWAAAGEFETTGHVAVVTEVTDAEVRIVEQNVEERVWPEGRPWSRALPMERGADGAVTLRCTYADSEILGWMLQTADATDAVIDQPADPALFALRAGRVDPVDGPWLDESDPANAAFVAASKGHRLAMRDEDRGRYFTMSETARAETRRATNELHAMFMRATAHVLADPALLARFGLPEALLPRLLRSWENRRTHVITGRFDFAMTPAGLKVYEYNVDSASCHFETARAQGAWAAAHGVTAGADPGARLAAAFTQAWRDSHVEGALHILKDDDPEEEYHALHMLAAAEAAGVRCKIITGMAGLDWDAAGRVVDADGERIDWVWKTWAWETALDQLRDEAVDEDAFLDAGGDTGEATRHDGPPRLIDVLLNPDVMVFEPLWTLIPSNKAILPVLWSLYPDDPWLLEAHFEVTEGLAARGYVSKPIVGRCGRNITMVDRDDNVLAETAGQFDTRDIVYQSMFKLPEVGGLRVQVCTFTVDGLDAGACLRCDPSLVVTVSSDVLPLRIVPDADYSDLPRYG